MGFILMEDKELIDQINTTAQSIKNSFRSIKRLKLAEELLMKDPEYDRNGRVASSDESMLAANRAVAGLIVQGWAV